MLALILKLDYMSCLAGLVAYWLRKGCPFWTTVV